MPRLGRVPHLEIAVDAVMVSAADALARDKARIDEIRKDALCGALGDARDICDVAEANAGVAGYAREDLCVIGDEPPAPAVCQVLTFTT